MEHKLIHFLLKYRYLLAVFSLLITGLSTLPAKNLYFESDYKIYYEADNPQLLAHEEMQEIYTKSDTLGVLIKPVDNDVFTQQNLNIIHEITELGWQTPFVIRVDSLTNFQHTTADGEDLSVASLLDEEQAIDSAAISRIRRVALTEKSIVKNLVSADGTTAMINITVELPEEIDPEADQTIQAQQREVRDASHPEVVAYGNKIIDEYQAKFPGLEMHLIGVSVINNTFTKSSIDDISTLVPLMYLMIIVTLVLFLRSLGSVVGTLIVIASASIVGVMSAAWLGYGLNTINAITPTVVLTIAVCDSVHLLVVYLRGLSMQLSPIEAMSESMRLNLQPIVLTSVTTAVGFLTLNFSIAPPFAQFGNMTAIGVIWAMVLTFTLLPCITLLLVRKRKAQPQYDLLLTRYATFVVEKRKPVFVFTILAAIAIMLLIPLNHIDDDPITYFKPGVPFRDASDFMSENLPGVKDINFSIKCGAPGCVNDVGFLNKLDAFDAWLYANPQVVHASSYIDVMKRLNRSMNQDNQAYYSLPESSDLSAQYNLLYEMSLPYGLDLNNQLNIDKSSTRVSVRAARMKTAEMIQLEQDASQWIETNYPELEVAGSSVTLMFAHLGVKNINSMLSGSLLAIIGVTLTILIALRSIRYALISMVPNTLPAFIAFGLWGVLVGQVNMAVATVFSITLGILVDDTVHFISKYRRARQVKNLSPEESIHYAFENVGSALIITTVVLVLGFSLLMLSDFNLNSMTGMLTAMTIAIALVFDFLILPPLLMMFDKDVSQSSELETLTPESA